MRTRRLRVVLMCAFAITTVLVVIGCATIMHGTTQSIGISSSPTGASVVIDNIDLGATPVIAEMSRKDNHIVRIEMEGFEPFEATITRSVSGWVWGNILFGGLIGLAVDAITGGLYKLKPESVEGVLSAGLGYEGDHDGILYVRIVLQPDSSWERIGNLQKKVP